MTLSRPLLTHQRFCLPVSRRPLCRGPSHACVPSSQGRPASSLQPWDTNTNSQGDSVKRFIETDVATVEEERTRKTGDVCFFFCVHVFVIVMIRPNTHTHWPSTSPLCEQNVTKTIRPEAEILHHHPYSLYIWSLVNQSCVSWDSGLCYCLVGVVSTQMQLCSAGVGMEHQPKWNKKKWKKWW